MQKYKNIPEQILLPGNDIIEDSHYCPLTTPRYK